MSDLLRPPSGWTVYHTIALLLVAASCIDGDVDPDEVDTIHKRLYDYPDLEGDSYVVLRAAVRRYEALRQADQVLPALDRHCRQMAKSLDPFTRRTVLDDIIAVIGADDEVQPSEQEFLQAVYRHFGMDRPR